MSSDYFSSISSAFFALYAGYKRIRIVTLGLDRSGKTTILYRLRMGEVFANIPVIGFLLESVRHRNVEFLSWDVGPVGGQAWLRRIWKYYFQNTHGIAYVVDSADSSRIGESRDALDQILSSEQLVGLPLLVLSNKQDLPYAVSVSEMTQKLGLHTLRGRPWHIQACCAEKGDGIREGIDWLMKEVSKI